MAFDTVQNKPLCNVFLTMLHQLGIEAEQFASSTAPITEIRS
jgi:hypothetical protein